MNTSLVDKSPFKKGDLVEDRYRILERMSVSAGMSSVYKAEDIITSELVVIKTVMALPPSEDERLSFDRESLALARLSHPNIVSLQSEGRTNDGTPYLVFPWLGDDLARRVQASGPMTWKVYYENYGRPVLDALRHAQARKIAHRDLKPQNILLGAGDHPYIIDFGIARCVDKPQIGPTLKFAGTQPYTPPEVDDGYMSGRRDIYSWAAITVTCLTGKLYQDLPGLQKALNSLRNSEAPKEELERALSVDPECRHETASSLLAQIDRFHIGATGQQISGWVIHLVWSSRALEQVKGAFPTLSSEQLDRLVSEDLAIACAGSCEETPDETRLILVGATMRLTCVLHSTLPDRFQVYRVDIENPSLAQRRRENMAELSEVNLVFGPPANAGQSLQETRALLTRILIAEQERVRLHEEKAKYRWFDCWATFLREKERFYKEKQVRLRARKIEAEDGRFIATINDEFSEDTLGESVLIQLPSGRPLVFAVEAVVADQLVMRLVSGAPHLVPTAGATIEGNFEAERQALNRQRNAVEEVRRGECVNIRLLDIICDPKSAAAPEFAGLDASATKLSPDKLQILDAALGVQSVHAVKGPPGTGKTSLIAELISIYLRRNPKKRILLSSQTHVALDHVIAKLQENNLGDDVVRVSSTAVSSAMKVQESVRHLTLDQKARKWSVLAEERGRNFINRYAAKLGFNSEEVEAAVLGRSLLGARDHLRRLSDDLQKLSDQESLIETARQESIMEGEGANREQVVYETTTLADQRERLKTERDRTEARIARIEESLRSRGGYGQEIADSDAGTAAEWIQTLDPTSDVGSKLKSLINLQLEWFDRLGDSRCLHGAVLSDSRVAAGTCIGLASTHAIYQQEYDLCIIDEASKATATETLVPMARSKTWVLVGDPEQLPPFFEDRALGDVDGETRSDLEKTMLAIILESAPEANIGQLKQQRRMVKGIGELISQVFYRGELENMREDADRHSAIGRAFPMPVTWISTSSKKCRELQNGSSYTNPAEVRVVVECMRRLSSSLKGAKENIKVAVISCYSAQVRALKEALEQDEAARRNLTLEVNTVDAFQGRDADVCIYSVTRSNDHQNIGFQRERRRLNVALSRARDALIIVGDDRFCRSVAKNNPFQPVLAHISENADSCAREEA